MIIFDHADFGAGGQWRLRRSIFDGAVRWCWCQELFSTFFFLTKERSMITTPYSFKTRGYGNDNGNTSADDDDDNEDDDDDDDDDDNGGMKTCLP